eukprot:NODE_290_length_1959_cov_93.966492_g242_i0.p1 GENE.NODE_290_length_1959_cov_93.966492_g242_i0~~NODE_290_length_1959_cov_93.966492_g242_i0.p1  ORF type:complete len:236 (+),score=62.91 NODE_290_length_1959_cov_93.966492_g242_i0:1153-1860(+)
MGPRPPTTRPLEEVKAEKEMLQSEVARGKRKLTATSLFELEREYKAALRPLESERTTIQRLETAFKKLDEGCKRRINRLTAVCRHCQQNWSLRFNNMLTHKGHAGHLDFDTMSKELSVTVHLDATHSDVEVAPSDLRSLSGGEKSFVSLALMLALWPVAESPFRCMDEFDVFMDDIYRKKAFDLLMENCRYCKNGQYIIFTPLSYKIQSSPDLKVHMLKPVKGQTTMDRASHPTQ